MFDTPRSLINALGGYRQVAMRLGRGSTTLHGYITDSKIPAKFFDAFETLCAERGIDTPPRALFAFEELKPLSEKHTEDAA